MDSDNRKLREEVQRLSDELERNKELLQIQRELALTVTEADDLDNALMRLLKIALMVEGVDSGGIYLMDDEAEELRLYSHVGLSDSFLENVRQFRRGTPQYKMVLGGKALFGSIDDAYLASDNVKQERLRAVAVIPVRSGEKAVAALNLASHRVDEISEAAQGVLLMIAARIGGIIMRLKSEEEALTAKKNFQNLFDSISDFLFILDDKGDVLHWNPVVGQRLGYSPEELSSMNVLEFHPEDRREEAGAIVKRMLEGELDHCPIPLETKSGEKIPVETKVTLGSWGRKQVLFGISRDVSEHRRAEAAMIRAKESAEIANKSKSEFLANMSHEVRTPINGILGMLQLLQTTDTDVEQEEYISRAIQSSKRLAQLLADILDLSKVEADHLTLHPAPFKPVEAISHVCELFQPLTEQNGNELVCRISSELPGLVIGDVVRLQQVLTNLVGNALKFTNGGRVTVDVFPLPSRGEHECRMLFTVGDNGLGISDDKIGLLFQPFTQVGDGFRREFHGAGLGLAICKRLVTLMGGNISIESEPGKGTHIHFCLGFRPAESESHSESPRDAEEAPAPSALKLLLAEDERVNSIATSRLLQKRGHTVDCVENGAEAVSRLRSENYDVVLMDIQMPVMDGVEAIKTIRGGGAGESARHVPIVAMTAYAMAGDKENFLAAGASDYVAKPVELAQLEDAFERIVER